MKIIFKDPKIKNGTIKVSTDGGINYIDYRISEVLENGISLGDLKDFTNVKIKGPANILQSADVVSSIKLDGTKGIKFILDTDTYGFNFPDCVVGAIIQDGITSIGEYNFYNYKNLSNIIIPNTVTRICQNAFTYCTNLTSINIPENVNKIDSYAFQTCSNLIDINIPEGITIINNRVFRNCKSLASLTIPAAVKTIDSYAFENCSSLKTIYFKGTETQWNSISKKSNWNYKCPDMQIIYNYQD